MNPKVKQSTPGVIELQLNQGYTVEVMLGSNNQTSNMSISLNTDMIIIPSSECATKCERRSYMQY